MANFERSLPWVEKYRPSSLEDLISHQDIIMTLRRFVHEGRLPHLLLYGPAGTGKTSTVLALAREIYSRKEMGSMVLELNASDDRGIGIVRGEILNFASTKTIFNQKFKLVILDEADAMTNDAQNALRRVIEKYTENTRFCLICNYLTGIIPALQSRCTRFRFSPLEQSQLSSRVRHVATSENIQLTEDGLKGIVQLAGGDLRKAINILQSSSMAADVVTEASVYLCTGQPLPADIRQMLSWMLNDDLAVAHSNIAHVKVEKGLALQDILSEVHTLVTRMALPANAKMKVLAKMADLEYRLSNGTSEKIQLSALICLFHLVRKDLSASKTVD